MEMDHVYIELAPKAGTISQLRAEADAHRVARSARPQQEERFGRVRALLAAALSRATGVETVAVVNPIVEE